jgi:hypothetical protein
MFWQNKRRGNGTVELSSSCAPCSQRVSSTRTQVFARLDCSACSDSNSRFDDQFTLFNSR